MSQIVERFAAAVQALVGEGPVKNRLMTAYTEFLEDLQQVDLPISSKRELSELHSALHRAKAVGKVDCVQASVQKMSSRDAWRHAQSIVQLYAELVAMEHCARNQSDNPLRVTETPPPRFLARRGS